MDMGKAVTTNLITFGAGYGVGSAFAGLALKSFNLTQGAVKAVSTVAGAIVGAGANSGTYYVVARIRGETVTIVKLLIEAASGLVSGAKAGYLAAKAQIVEALPNNISEV